MAAEITAKDKALIRESWTYVEKDYLATGNILFRELFTVHPEYTKLFERMKSKPDEDLFENDNFKKHITTALFPAIAQMLINLDFPDKLKAQLHEIGVNHRKRNLTRQNFQAIQEVILTTLRLGLGDLLSGEAEEAWNKILTVAFNEISLVLEDNKPVRLMDVQIKI